MNDDIIEYSTCVYVYMHALCVISRPSRQPSPLSVITNCNKDLYQAEVNLPVTRVSFTFIWWPTFKEFIYLFTY